VKGMGNT